jgi:outer membrane receptor protein involved in Fe transport
MKAYFFRRFSIRIRAMIIFNILSSIMIAQTFPENADSLLSVTINGIVVTANRYENEILNTGASVSTLGEKTISHLPVKDLSSTLKYIPGIFATSGDGMGLNPQVSVRGFYGGGEAEYLTVLIDGIPVNNLENGLVSWNLMPLFNIHSIEVLRGGSSALYGDAAMGGVINLITDKPEKSFTRAIAGYGSFNSYNIGLNHGGKINKGFYELYVNNEGTDGFRDHSEWNSVTFGGKAKLSAGRNSTLTLNANGQLLNFDNPGPVNERQIASDRAQSIPYYVKDGSDYMKIIANADLRQKINDNTDMSVSLGYQHKASEATTTYTQPPVILNINTFQPIDVYDTTLYGNSKVREITTDQALFAVRLITTDPSKLFKLSGGIEADFGRFDNQVFNAFQGFENDYQNNYLTHDSLEFAGEGFRFKTAAYLNGEIPLFDELKLIGGLRYDLIADSFDSDIPKADTSMDKTYNSISPKIALSLSTGETARYKGTIFAGYSRAFKAPTIDQRTDLKSMSAAVFFQSGNTYIMEIITADPYSNSELKPQRSNNFELGTYQFYRFSEKFAAEINLTGYFIEVKDEIDFDLTDFRYRNISSSRHTGLETAINLYLFNNLTGFVNLNAAEVKFASGENKGKYLKGIPRLSQMVGISYAPERGPGGSLSFNGASGMYLDDENTTKLNPYSVFSTRINYSFHFISVYLDIENVFDKRYNSTGYLLYGAKYLFPAAGRTIRGGLVLNL